MLEKGFGIDNVAVGAGIGVAEHVKWQPHWRIEKYRIKKGCKKKLESQPYAVEEFDGNILLNEGITLLLTLLIGGAGTAYNNANARIGVGDSTTAAAATQTGLQAAINRAWKAMDATYPQVASQTVTFRASFGASEANFSWQEFTLVNAADDTGTNLNRKVENHGVKANGDTWVAQVSITIA